MRLYARMRPRPPSAQPLDARPRKTKFFPVGSAGFWPHRADEGDEFRDFAPILDAGRAFDAGGDVDAPRVRVAQRLRDISRIQPAGEQPRLFRCKAGQQRPVESDAIAAGTKSSGPGRASSNSMSAMSS